MSKYMWQIMAECDCKHQACEAIYLSDMRRALAAYDLATKEAELRRAKRIAELAQTEAKT